MTAPFRISATAANRKLLALSFIKRYFAEHGASPSYREIAAALGTNTARVHDIVRKLARDGAILRDAGRVRGIQLPGGIDQLSEGDALCKLRELGWRINGAGESVEPPPVTHSDLPVLPILDHAPVIDADGGDDNGGTDG